eukprot:4009559-Pyramimonas_sp.AAC.1
MVLQELRRAQGPPVVQLRRRDVMLQVQAGQGTLLQGVSGPSGAVASQARQILLSLGRLGAGPEAQAGVGGCQREAQARRGPARGSRGGAQRVRQGQAEAAGAGRAAQDRRGQCRPPPGEGQGGVRPGAGRAQGEAGGGAPAGTEAARPRGPDQQAAEVAGGPAAAACGCPREAGAAAGAGEGGAATARGARHADAGLAGAAAAAPEPSTAAAAARARQGAFGRADRRARPNVVGAGPGAQLPWRRA